jgi:hypothetical protein
MNRASELIDDAVSLLRDHGFNPIVSNGGSGHRKIRWADRGRRYMLVVSQSPSDRNTRRASLATLRRILRNNGMQGGAP